MDMMRIGAFLAELRREQGLTQEALGEALGVSNKTVSRWETGTYLPPVEMLQRLSERYGVSINELLSGERLTAESYREKAEENIKSTLAHSDFSVKERMAFFKRKWLQEHWTVFVVCAIALLVIALALRGRPTEAYILCTVVAIAQYLILRNRMMAYVEGHVFDRSPREADSDHSIYDRNRMS